MRGAAPCGTFPPTALQRAMVSASRQAPRDGLYLIQDVCESIEELDAERLQRAWREVARRHPALTTSFATGAGGDLQQRVHDEPEVSWQEADWTTVAPDEKEERLAGFLRQDRERGFDFDAGIPMRFALLRMAHPGSVLIWTVHHGLVDGRSLAIVWREWFACYDALGDGAPIRLADAEPFHDNAGRVVHQDLAEAERYWRQRYAGITEIRESIVDRLGRPGTPREGQGKEEVCLPAEETAALERLAAGHGISVHNLVQGVWALLLARYAGLREIVFGVTRAGRRAPGQGTGEMVGLLINTLPFRITVDADAPVMPWLQEIGEQWARLRAYEHTPPEKIREWSGLPPGMPLFDTILIYDHEPPAELPRQLGGSWAGRSLRRVQRTGVPLTLVAYGRPLLRLEVVYDRRRYTRETAAGVALHLQALLRSILAEPGASLAAVKMLTAEEEAWLSADGAAAARDERVSVCRLLESQAAQAPDRVALEFEGGAISYGELNRRANQLAHYLRRHGAGPEDLIAICMGCDPQAVTAIVAVLKAGAAFLALDPSLPPERLQQMVAAVRPKLVLGRGASAAPPHAGAEVVDADRLQREMASLPEDDPPGSPLPDHAAYAAYTSGSTGTPKAALLTHRALLNHALATAAVYGITHHDRRLQLASPGSDMFVAEVFNYLCHGATLVFHPQARRASVAEFERVLRDLRITVVGTPASWWNEWAAAIAEDGWAPPPALRAVITGMERVSPAALQKWTQSAGSRVRLFNAYGPSEASPTTTIYEAGTSAWEGGACVPIGKPIENVRTYVLDRDGNLVPVGVAGELFIGGSGVARGYLNELELTAERFVPDPFDATGGKWAYRTGDRVFRLPDGNLAFLGRQDRQVKIRGFRVELDEVEGVLGRHAEVRQCAVIVRGGEGRPGLIAYAAPAAGATLGAAQLGLHVRRYLPEYMVPAAFVILPELPRTSSGKVDRLALAALAPEAQAGSDGQTAPVTELERRLTELWQRVLGLSQVSVTGNFFLIGGDSVRAAELLALIHRELGFELPMAAFLRVPTIAGLAAAADGRARPKVSAAEAGVLRFHETGERPPLFCISSQGDDAPCFRHLAARLGPKQPLYALPGPDGGDRLGEVEGTARRACAAIRGIRPSGPYLLGGYCFGGIVAFEVARQLIAAGAEVPLMALFDVPAPGHPRFARALGRQARAPRPLAVPVVHYMAQRDATLGDRLLHFLADPRPGWRRVSGRPVRVVWIDGTHATLLQEPHAARIAASLEELVAGVKCAIPLREFASAAP